VITYIPILRGINVSGHKIIKMEHLKKLLASLGFASIIFMLLKKPFVLAGLTA
jgi:uncharacterized protein (DUF1697 family)